MNGFPDLRASFWVILFTAGALHGFYLSILLFFMVGNQKANRWFSLLIFLFSMQLINYLAFISRFIEFIPHFYGSTIPLLYVIGPAFYFYVRAQLDPHFKISGKTMLHFALPAWELARWMPFYFKGAPYKLKLIHNFFNSAPPHESFADFLRGYDYLLLILVYAALAYRFIRLSPKPANSHESRHGRNQISLLKQAVTTLATLATLALLICSAVWLLRMDGTYAELSMVWGIAIAMHVLGYFVISRSPNFLNGAKIAANGEKYLTSPLTKEKMAEGSRRLLDLMQHEKPFLDGNLKIADIARKLAIPSHHLSQILTQELGTTFYDLLNTYRIQEAKSRLSDSQYRHYKIEAIAQEVGFKNKVSFNRIFKKITGCTPSEYRNNNSEP